MNSRIQKVSIVVAIGIASLTGCKKHVAAAAPTSTPAPAAAPAPAPTITLRATPATLDRGQVATLQWDAKNASSVQIQPALGTVTSTGTRSVNPTSSVTYTATATGPGGTVPFAPAATRNDTRPTPNVSLTDLFRQNIQAIYFDYDQSEIRPDQRSRLQSDAAWLKEHPGVKFVVEGNCDDRGSEEYNLALGDRRANAVKEFLVKQGVPQSSIMTVSYGEERPICREDSEKCFEQNRRASFTPSS